MGLRFRLAFVLLASMAVAWAVPAGAMAHASLVQSDPADGAVLGTAPSRFVLRFNEPVLPLAIRVIDAAGESRNLPLPAPADVLALPAPDLARGSFALSWRVVSEDGHPVGGSLLFSIGGPAGSRPVTVQATSDPVARTALWLARLLIACGLAFGIGGVVVRHVSHQDPAGTSSRLAALLVLGLTGALVLPGLQGLDALDLPWTAITKGITWRVGAGTSFGLTAALAATACVTALAALVLRGGAGKALAVMAAGLAALAPAASGHAASAPPRALMSPMVVLHVLAAALWLGAFGPLAASLARGERGTDLLRRLSSILPLPVAVLVASGIVLGVVQLQTPAALVETAYGRVLLAKLALVAALIGVAAANRWLWTAAALAGEAAARTKLRRAVFAEIVLAVAILGVAGLWRFTPPPRALAAERAAPAFVHIHTAQAMADLVLTPGRAGPLDASVVIMTGDFGPLDAKEVSLALSRPDLGLEPIVRQAARAADGTWVVRGLSLPAPGTWPVRIKILVDDFHLAELEGEVVLNP